MHLSKYLFFLLILCSSTLSMAQSSNLDRISVPNIFTPNNDEINDLFEINADSLTSLNVSIFNRWGEEIARMNGIKDHWDGRTSSGIESPEGFYFYAIEAEWNNQEKISINGIVFLLR